MPQLNLHLFIKYCITVITVGSRYPFPKAQTYPKIRTSGPPPTPEFWNGTKTYCFWNIKQRINGNWKSKHWTYQAKRSNPGPKKTTTVIWTCSPDLSTSSWFFFDFLVRWYLLSHLVPYIIYNIIWDRLV